MGTLWDFTANGVKGSRNLEGNLKGLPSKKERKNHPENSYVHPRTLLRNLAFRAQGLAENVKFLNFVQGNDRVLPSGTRAIAQGYSPGL